MSIVLYRKSNGNEIIYSGMKNNELMGYVRTTDGRIYNEQSVGSILARGYWQVVFENVLKHQTHDQSTHGRRGGRGSAAGGKTTSRAEMEALYRESGFTVAPSASGAVEAYVADGAKINGTIRRGELSSEGGEVSTTNEPYVFGEFEVVALDKTIEAAPAIPNTAVWRVASIRSVEGLQVGDVVKDKGYQSTTIVDLTSPDAGVLLLTLNGVSKGRKQLVQINTGEKGKGLYMAGVSEGSSATAQFEQEFLMPRDLSMEYLGIVEFPLKNGRSMDIHQFKVVDS